VIAWPHVRLSPRCLLLAASDRTSQAAVPSRLSLAATLLAGWRSGRCSGRPVRRESRYSVLVAPSGILALNPPFTPFFSRAALRGFPCARRTHARLLPSCGGPAGCGTPKTIRRPRNSSKLAKRWFNPPPDSSVPPKKPSWDQDPSLLGARAKQELRSELLPCTESVDVMGRPPRPTAHRRRPVDRPQLLRPTPAFKLPLDFPGSASHIIDGVLIVGATHQTPGSASTHSASLG
jgi:hypothetical protein